MVAAKLSVEDAALERVRRICMGFPGAEEKLSHGAPSFHVRGKMFVMFVDDHHADGRLAVWCNATHESQLRLVRSDGERFFVPPYVGVRGWIGVRLDHPGTDWIDLAILVEEGWTSVAPKTLTRDGTSAPRAPAPPPPVRAKTDAKAAKEGLSKLERVCLALPEATMEKEARHATFRVGKKVFTYFLDNHHGDGNVAACVKVPTAEGARLVVSQPKRFFSPAYIGSRGWVGIRLDVPKVDWKDVAARVKASYVAVAPKKLGALAV
jgi:hypothetical protein